MKTEIKKQIAMNINGFFTFEFLLWRCEKLRKARKSLHLTPRPICFHSFAMNTSFSQKRLQFIPPEKGSFPLDHEGFCKKHMLKYFGCLRENRDDNSACREQSKDYLACRMEHGLMGRESWEKLGYSGDAKKNSSEQ
jgi:CHCH domain